MERQQDAVPPVGNQIRRPMGTVRRQTDTSAGHGLKQNVRKTFVTGGQQKETGPFIPVSDVSDPARDVQVGGRIGIFAQQPVQGLLLIDPVIWLCIQAKNDEVQIRTTTGQRNKSLHEPVESFLMRFRSCSQKDGLSLIHI